MTRKVFKIMLIVTIMMSSLMTLSGCKKNEENQKEEEISREVYVQPLQDYLEGLKTKNLELVLKAYPEFMHMNEKIQLSDIEAVYGKYEALYGSNVVFEYKISDDPVVIDEEGYGRLAAQIKEAYPDAGDIVVDKAYILGVELTISGDGIKEENKDESNNEENKDENAQSSEEQKKSTTDHQDFYVYRTDGNWYIF